MNVSVWRWVTTLIFIVCAVLPCVVTAKVRIESEVPQLRAALEGVVSRFQTDVERHFSFVGWDGVSVHGVEDQRALEKKRLALGLSKPPSWAFGVCYPASKVVILRLDGSIEEIERTLVHELVHLVFGVGFGSSQVPAWFSEGVAQMFEQGLNGDRRDTLNHSRLRGPPIALEDLTHRFPHHGSRAQYAYVQAEQMTWFIHDELGRDRFRALIRSLLVEELRFERAFESFLGYPLSDFEKKFVDSTLTEKWWHELFRETVLFTFTGIILVIGGFRRRQDVIARIRRLRKLEDAEDD